MGYGNNRVYCAGRFVTGPDGRACLGTCFLIFVPSILWQISTSPYYAQQYSPVLPIIGAFLSLSSLTLLFTTALSDPGIVPRQREFTEQYDKRTKSFRVKQPVRYYDVVLRGHPWKLKYCTTCNIYRPPRCTHCSVCDSCVERFDHHCPWIGNCVGRRNYKYFYSFVTCTGALNVYVLTTSLLHVVFVSLALQTDDPTNYGSGSAAFLRAMAQEPISTALAIYNVLVVWFTVGLSLYHAYLIMSNQTTYEQIKGAYCNGANPFDRGAAGNCADILCSPVRPRYFDAKSGQLLWPKRTGAPSCDTAAGEENETAHVIGNGAKSHE